MSGSKKNPYASMAGPGVRWVRESEEIAGFPSWYEDNAEGWTIRQIDGPTAAQHQRDPMGRSRWRMSCWGDGLSDQPTTMAELKPHLDEGLAELITAAAFERVWQETLEHRAAEWAGTKARLRIGERVEGACLSAYGYLGDVAVDIHAPFLGIIPWQQGVVLYGRGSPRARFQVVGFDDRHHWVRLSWAEAQR